MQFCQFHHCIKLAKMYVSAYLEHSLKGEYNFVEGTQFELFEFTISIYWTHRSMFCYERTDLLVKLNLNRSNCKDRKFSGKQKRRIVESRKYF